MKILKFTEENIYRLFGNEAAENESMVRLKEYYFKSRTYEQIVGELPLRILVGHKGIGKSALFKIAMSEDLEKGTLPILIKPDDIAEIANHSQPFLKLISDWKKGLVRLITEKILTALGIETERFIETFNWRSGQFMKVLATHLKKWDAEIKDEQARAAVEQFLLTSSTTVYIDDLDRGWEGKSSDITRISALLNAVRDLSSDQSGIRFRIALRSDVYFLVRTSDESTDKIEGSVIWYSWTNHDILILLVKRIETFYNRQIDEARLSAMDQIEVASFLNPVMDTRFHGRGKWQNIPMYRILMSLIRKRPRDLVKLCTLAARNAFNDNSSRLLTKHFEASFEEYSQGRIQDAINEYKSELPQIERLVMSLRPPYRTRMTRTSFSYSTDELIVKLNRVMQGGRFRFANGRDATARQLAHFLYKVNVLTAYKQLDSGEIQRKYFEESRYLSNQFTDFGYAWEVHPAYRWALQPETVDDILESLHLARED